jgi:OOP family OmpA-OmpF porin
MRTTAVAGLALACASLAHAQDSLSTSDSATSDSTSTSTSTASSGAVSRFSGPRHYLSFMGAYELPDTGRGVKREGAGLQALYGYLFTPYIGIEAGFKGSVFEHGPTNGTDYYQNGLSVDAVFNFTDRTRASITPYFLIGGGGVYDDGQPSTDKQLNGFAEAGLGLVSGVLSDNFPIRLRAEGRYLHDFYKTSDHSGFNDYRALAGVEIPLGRTIRYIEVPVEKVQVQEVVKEVPRPWVDSDGDGVDDEHDKCPDTPRGLKVDADGCVIPGQSIELRGITFEFNKARLMPNAQTVLDYVVKGMLGQPTMKVELAGHTDTIGSEQYNLKLSQRRAEAVREYLMSRGVKPEQLVAKGYGKSQLLVSPEKTDADRELNRRVEFKVLEK